LNTIRNLVIAVLVAYAATAQAPPQPTPAPSGTEPTRDASSGIASFTSTTSIVVVNVAVTGRDGKPVENLTKQDFQVYEDGKLQTLETCDFQQLGTAPLPPQGSQASNPPAAAVAAPPSSPASPGSGRFENRRLVVMLFDFSSMEAGEQTRARDAALKFLSSQMTSSDIVSLMTFGNQLQTIQDFTSDRDLLTAKIKSFRVGDSSELAGMADTGADAEDQSGTFVADDTEFNIFNTDRKLAALEEATRRLAAHPEKKALVYFSSGVEKTGVENQSQLEATVNAAVRANVAFYPIDARGLLASAPGGDATKASAVGSGLFSGKAQRSVRDSFQNSQETLYTLAADTGGKALLDSNDLTEGLRQVQHDIGSYYLLAYRSSNSAQDGRYRKIQVKLAPQHAALKAKLNYRQGYFAPAVFAKMRDADKESQLQQALESANPVTDLPLAVEVDYFRLAKDKYFVPVTVRLPGSALSFREKGSKRATALDFIAQVRDVRGRAVDAVRDTIPLKLDESRAGEVSRKHIQYDTGMTLAPGRYTLRFVARENGEGKIGTFETTFTVPDLNAEKALRLSSLVLSSGTQPLNQQLGGAKNSKKLVAQNPLVSKEGEKLVPNVTRVWRPSQTLLAFLEVYDPTVPEGLPPNMRLTSVASSFAFYRGDQKVFEAPAVQVQRLDPNRADTAQLRLRTPLANLQPGKYTVQVNVIDELGRKFAFPRAPIAIVADATTVAAAAEPPARTP
jgi:VWFA-related protein